MMTSINEWTHFFTKIYNSHTLFSKGLMSVVCERWVETRTDCYIDPSSSLDHSSSSSASWLGLLNRGTLGPQPSVCKLVLTLAFLSPIDSTAADTCVYSFITPTCFRSSSVYLHRCISWLTARSRVNIIFTQPLRSGRIWHKVNFLSGV